MTRMITGLTLVAICAGSVFAGNSDNYVSSVHPQTKDFCFSSPILAAQLPSAFEQCASSSGTPRNTTSRNQQVSDADEDTSGGWAGPHGCEGNYCVYNNPSFASGRGISIISDGESANLLANLPIFTELAGAGASNIIQTASINIQTQSIETRNIPGKGRGFVATRPIQRGEQILAYTPALVIHRSFVDDLTRGQQLRLLRDAVSRLPTPTRTAFWKQLGQTHEDGDDDVLEIIMNNSFNLPLTLSSGTSFIGNFPEVSMYNHDCRPNVAFHLDAGLIHRTHAVRQHGFITPGEELSISYVDSFRAREVRRARTRQNWGFACTCAQCTLPEALANASDHRLWRIYEVENALLLDPKTKVSKHRKGSDGARGPSVEEELDKVELLLSLYEQERLLDSHGSSAYRLAALNYNAFRRRQMAVKYALLALEAGIVEDGARSMGVDEMVALMGDPEGHWSWGKKK